MVADAGFEPAITNLFASKHKVLSPKAGAIPS